MSTQEDFLKRLESVTSRLEAIAGQKPALAPKPTNLGGPSGELIDQIPDNLSLRRKCVIIIRIK